MRILTDRQNWGLISKHRSEIMGVATLSIVVFHIQSFCSIGDLPLLSRLLGQMNIGVEIFLFLSGVGLFYSFNNRKVKFTDYYTKRILNVYLPFLFINFPFMIYESFVIGNDSAWSFLLCWTGISNWIGTSQIGWYVSFAMITYLIYPVIFNLLNRQKSEMMQFCFTVSMVIISIAFCFVLYYRFTNLYNIFEIAITRLPIFFIGCYFGSIVYHHKKMSYKTILMCLMSIVLWFVLAYIDVGPCARLSKCLLSITIVIILSGFFEFINIKWIKNLFSFFGGISLEMYLLHIAFARVICRMNGHDSIFSYLIVVIISILISFPISKFRNAIVRLYVNKKTN